MKLITSTQYVREATKAIDDAQTRVYLTSMVIADHDATRPLIEALKNAAKRGIKVVVAADIFTYGEVNGGFLPFRYYSHGTRATNKMVKLLKKAGVEFHWLGRGRITMFHGRTHSKWCVADDTVFTFGGVNLYEEGVHNADYMFRLEDAKLADRIVEEQVRIQKAEQQSFNYYSSTYEHGDVKALFDGGIIGQSIIYNRVLDLCEKAEHITFVSQYCPSGKLASFLKNKNATIYYNRPLQADGLNRFAIRFNQFFTGLTSLYIKPRYLHAKFIIFTMKNGKKVAITGSHNFAYTGVLLGTREIALETKDPEVIKQLEAFIAKEIA